MTIVRTLGAIAGALLLCLPGIATAQTPSPIRIGAQSPPPAPPLSALTLNQACVDVSKIVTPTVVSISVGLRKVDEMRMRHFEEYFRPFLKKDKKEKYGRRINGSGVLVSPDGFIITNNHVIEDADEDSILVKLTNKEAYWATLVGRDERTDLALLKIYGRNLPTAFIANSDSVAVGEWVLAVGNPLSLASTVTAGIVSAKGRTEFEMEDDRTTLRSYIQTDAAINPGNSGGGLFDLHGQLIGINTLLYSYSGYFVGYGFAIPSNVVRSIVEDLADDGKVERGEMGIIGENVTPELMRSLKLDSVAGIHVTEVDSAGAAEAAGLRSGDAILSVDSLPLADISGFREIMALRRPGETIRLMVSRDGKKFERDLTLRRTLLDANRKQPALPVGKASLDLTVGPLSDEKSRAQSFTGSGGLVALSVDKYGAGAKTGLHADDILTAVDGRPVASAEDLQSILSSHAPGDVVGLTYWRAGKSISGETVLSAARGKDAATSKK